MNTNDTNNTNNTTNNKNTIETTEGAGDTLLPAIAAALHKHQSTRSHTDSHTFAHPFSPPPLPPPLDRKANGNGVLAKLSNEQRDTIYQWLLTDSVAAIQRKIAEPPPEGFGLKVQQTTLHRFFRRRRALERLKTAAELSAETPESLPMAAQFNEATTVALAHNAYELANVPNAAKYFPHLARWFADHEQAEIKRQYLDVARQQLELARHRLNHHRRVFEFNSTRAALNHAIELQAIAKDPNMDDEQKIWAARSLLYGALPDDQPQPKPLNQFIQ